MIIDYLKELEQHINSINELTRESDAQNIDIETLRNKVATLQAKIENLPSGGLSASDVFIGTYSNTKTTYSYGSTQHQITIPTTHTFTAGEKILFMGDVNFVAFMDRDVTDVMHSAVAQYYMRDTNSAHVASGGGVMVFPPYTPSTMSFNQQLTVPFFGLHTIQNGGSMDGTVKIPLSAQVNLYKGNNIVTASSGSWYYTALAIGVVLK